AAGPERSSVAAPAAAAAGAVAAGGAGSAGAAAAGPGAGFPAAFGGAAPTFTAPSPITPMMLPTATVAPSSARISASTPAALAFTSSVVLSVSISTSGSSTATRSPGFLSHFATVASVTDSPSAGTLIS